MGPKLLKVTVIVAIIVGITLLVELIADEQAAGVALTSMGVMLGAYYGVGWGGKQATKTEEYRQTLIGKRTPQATYYYDDAEEPDPTLDEERKGSTDVSKFHRWFSLGRSLLNA